MASSTVGTAASPPRLAASLPEAFRRTRTSDTLLIGVLPGEGVGPEVIGVALSLLQAIGQATGRRFDVRTGGAIGGEAVKSCGNSLSADVIHFCQETFDAGGAILCGPGGGRFVYDLRTAFDLCCKFTPIRPYPELHDAGPIRSHRTAGADIVVVRENTGGLYFGSWGREDGPDGEPSAYHHFGYSRAKIDRVLQIALDLAGRRTRRLTLVTKPGGVPAISQLWEERLAALNETSTVQARVLEIDNAAYQLVADPAGFDVIVCPNMFGDVIGDLGALLLASRGMSYSGNFGPGGRAVFQTAHGAAWDLAGTDTANPIGQVSSLAMMLREHFDLGNLAAAIERAVATTLRDGFRTPDIASPGCRVVGTRELGRQLRDRLDAILAEASA